jgi:hypothetical protein
MGRCAQESYVAKNKGDLMSRILKPAFTRGMLFIDICNDCPNYSEDILMCDMLVRQVLPEHGEINVPTPEDCPLEKGE